MVALLSVPEALPTRKAGEKDLSVCFGCGRVKLDSELFADLPLFTGTEPETHSHTVCPKCARRLLGIRKEKYHAWVESTKDAVVL